MQESKIEKKSLIWKKQTFVKVKNKQHGCNGNDYTNIRHNSFLNATF